MVSPCFCRLLELRQSKRVPRAYSRTLLVFSHIWSRKRHVQHHIHTFVLSGVREPAYRWLAPNLSIVVAHLP